MPNNVRTWNAPHASTLKEIIENKDEHGRRKETKMVMGNCYWRFMPYANTHFLVLLSPQSNG